MKRIIYENDEGNVCVISPSPCGLSIEQIAEKDVPKGKAYHIVDASEIPSDGKYMAAWKLNGKKIELHPEKKKKIDDDEDQRLVDEAVKEKQKDMAIQALIAEGKLDKDGKRKVSK